MPSLMHAQAVPQRPGAGGDARCARWLAANGGHLAKLRRAPASGVKIKFRSRPASMTTFHVSFQASTCGEVRGPSTRPCVLLVQI